MSNIIIVGGGIAGTAAAEELRRRDPKAHVTLISEEPHPCYSRVILAHYVIGKVKREQVFLRSSAWYAENDIEFMPGVRVLEIDIDNKFVRTSEDRELSYDKLLLTTGVEVNLLSDDLRGVSYFHTIDDADHLKALITELKALPVSEQSATIYGGGFIACEYINIFHQLQVPFNIVMRSSGFWSRLLSEHSQGVLRRQVESRGISIFFNEPMPELLGEDELRGIKLKDGRELATRLLGVGVGVAPELKILQAAKIPVAQGILTDEFLETEIKNVYAAGDAAEFSDTIVNRRVKYGNWMNAQMQGRAVGATLAGERTAFKLVSSYTANVLGLNLVFIGDVNREQVDEVRQTVAAENVSQELFIRDGKLVGAVLIGDVSARAALTKGIGQKM